MTPFPETAAVWAYKLAGSIAGSAVSLAYILPRGRREAAIRFAVGIVCGLVFGGTAGLKLSSELGITAGMNEAEVMLMGSAAASLAAWSVLGILARFAARLQANGIMKRNGHDG